MPRKLGSDAAHPEKSLAGILDDLDVLCSSIWEIGQDTGHGREASRSDDDPWSASTEPSRAERETRASREQLRLEPSIDIALARQKARGVVYPPVHAAERRAGGHPRG